MGTNMHQSLLYIFMLQSFWSTINNVPTEQRRPDPPCELTGKQNNLNSFLWTIKRNPPSYFFGTIHVPYTRVWDFIPENTKQAFEQSENVFFELDLTDPYTISALTSCQMLPQGKELSDVLPRDLYLRLKRHLEYVKTMMPSWMTADQRGQGLYADYLFNAITGNWERKRPVWVMLMVNSLTESDIKSRGIPVLDLYLAQEAERLSKRTGAVEMVEEQCVPLNGLNYSQVVFALNHTLYQQEGIRSGLLRSPYSTDDLIRHYNCGDLNTVIFTQDTSQVAALNSSVLSDEDVQTAQMIDDYFRQELIYQRNQRMAQRVDHLLQKYPDKSFFFAFGAGHFLGNQTVIDIMRATGYDVEHTTAAKKIKRVKGSKRQRSRQQRLQVAEPEKNIELPVTRALSKESLTGEQQPSRAKERNFNDLWVRIDSTTREPEKKFNELWVRIKSTTATYQQTSTDSGDMTKPFEWNRHSNHAAAACQLSTISRLLALVCCALSVVMGSR
ncbi:PREDICTED: metalloprotease TIKI1-like [Priapulus caudatus]|uniref:Metalloprotease TIKI homolog n=1 Tax=Priapulus caudatus TaxID=37621 RepID=A0ABM1EDP9_PRICU|nr:PREDICTED: metalloprotease TIKI1-like [Priapulus caudatus]